MTSFSDLPNELLTHILSYLPSLTLLELLRISSRIHNLAVDLLHRRIHHALVLDEHYLVFECYPSNTKTIAPPYFHCAYLGTWYISPSSSACPPSTTNTISTDSSPQPKTKIKQLQTPGTLYSHFTLIRSLPEDTLISLNPTYNFRASTPPETLVEDKFHLDAGAAFTLRTAHASLVKVNPGYGSLTSSIEVFHKEGVEVHRSWLNRAEEITDESFREGDISVRGKRGGGGVSEDALGEKKEGDGQGDGGDKDKERILWFGGDAGIKVRPKRTRPLLMAENEEPAATYVLYYESLMIRTVHLLVMLERSREEQALMMAMTKALGRIGTYV